MDVFIEQKLEIGKKYTLLKNTSSLKSKDTIEIKGFLDGDEDKILCDGILPGSWIDKKNLKVELKLKPNLRFKTIAEIVGEFGIVVIDGLSSDFCYVAGNQVEEKYTKVGSMSKDYITYRSPIIGTNILTKYITDAEKVGEIVDFDLMLDEEKLNDYENVGLANLEQMKPFLGKGLINEVTECNMYNHWKTKLTGTLDYEIAIHAVFSYLRDVRVTITVNKKQYIVGDNYLKIVLKKQSGEVIEYPVGHDTIFAYVNE